VISVAHEEDYDEYEIDHPKGFGIITDDLKAAIKDFHKIVEVADKVKKSGDYPLIDYYNGTIEVLAGEKEDEDERPVRTVIGQHDGEITYLGFDKVYSFDAPGITVYFTDMNELHSVIEEIDEFLSRVTNKYDVKKITYDEEGYEVEIKKDGIVFIFYGLPRVDEIEELVNKDYSRYKEIGEVTVYSNGYIKVGNENISVRSTKEDFGKRYTDVMRLYTIKGVTEAFYDDGIYGAEGDFGLVYWGKNCGAVFEYGDIDKIREFINYLYDEDIMDDDCYEKLVEDLDDIQKFMSMR
jgi:hypothetical protein